MKTSILVLLSLLFIISCDTKNPNAPDGLKIEYGSTIVDEQNPRFSWHIQDTNRGAMQSAYQVIVATAPSKLTDKKADIWNSGIVDSDQSIFVLYAGKKLESGKRYYWTVRTWDKAQVASNWAEESYFDMAFLEQEKWIAKWIGAEESEAIVDSMRPRSILLRNEFKLGKKIRLAKAYVTGLGSYQFFLNGEKVSKDLLTPGWTDYPTRIMYQVYDVSKILEQGNNAAGLLLGNVWYSSGLGWKGGSYYSQGPMHAMMQLEVEYEDGSHETIVTNEDWKWHFSPILENTLYHGETYDARLEIDNWNVAGLDENKWNDVDLFEDKQGVILSAHCSPPIQVTRTISPANIIKLDKGVWVVDMGINITGGIRLEVEGPKGTVITMKFAELLHEDGTIAQENLRSARATDKYILRGNGKESWEPAFTYHGFRYVEISGLPGDNEAPTVLGLNYHNAAEETGTFSCSEEILNKIQANIQNGQRSNMFSVPTDCPQRDERLGWMGDAQVFAATSCYNMDMSGFYAKWIRDIYDSQDPEGWVTDVNPAIVVTNPAKPAWGDAYTITPWEMYRFYGDKRILQKYYDGYKKWVEYMRSNTVEEGLYFYDKNEKGWEGYADWIAVVESPKRPITAAYYFYSTVLLARFADILGYHEDASEYTALASEIREAFQKKFFNVINNNYPGATQTAYLLPLNFGLAPPEKRDAIAENLLNDVIEKEYHPTTGFLGTKYLLPTLSDFGYHEAAYRTATSTEYPSWGYMVKNGATSMWELWNSDSEPPEGMNSRNHFALGSIGEWFYTHLAGIRIDPKQPAFKHSIIAPMPVKNLNWAEAKIVSPYGPLTSKWEKNGAEFKLEICIPANTSSTVYIPFDTNLYSEVLESGTLLISEGKLINKTEGILNTTINDDAIILDIGSGTYTFICK